MIHSQTLISVHVRMKGSMIETFKQVPLKVVPGRFMVAIFQRDHGFAQLVERDFPIFFQDEVKFLVQLLMTNVSIK